MTPTAPSTRLASLSLAGLAALHALWATGATWPARDRAKLADAVAGRPESGMPSAPACLVVAGLLATGALFVSGRPARCPGVQRLGSLGVAGVLTLRGLLGFAGRTEVVSPGSTSPRFRRLDRRYYSPLCLVLGTMSLPAATKT
jgi:hypothetical protein